MEKYREEGRDARGVSRIEDWVRVVRFTVRRLVRSPGYSSVVVLTLGIGLGAVTAIYALIHAILLSPLPFPESERLVAIKHTSRLAGHEEVGISGGLYQHYPSNAASFEQIAVYTESSVHYSDELADVELVQAASAGPELFEVLGVGPMAGRLFTTAEWEPVVAEPGLFNTGVRLPIVISHEFWRQRYHGSREVLGEIVEIRGAPREIVGGSRRWSSWSAGPPRRFRR